MLYLLLMLVFITIIFLVLVFSGSYSREEYTERIEGLLNSQNLEGETNQQKKVKTNLKDTYNAISKRLISTLALSQQRDKFDRYLEKADILFTVEEMLLIITASILLAAFLGYVITKNILLGVIFGISVIPIFRILINNKIRKKVVKLEGQLCDALDMIVSALRGGFSFLNALELISKDMPNPVAGEFGKVIKEISFGVTHERALNNLVERVPSEDLKLIVIATVIQIQTGGNLAEILNNISTTIRDRLQLKREVKTLTAQGKISGLIVGLLPVFLFIVIFMISPDYMRLLATNIIGLMMLGGAVMNMIIGFFLIKKIVDIKY